ncbi:MAG: hypothetical protein WCI51_11330 [Lentisphaerota bacterium]
MKKLFLCLSVLSILSMPLMAKVMVIKPDAPAAGELSLTGGINDENAGFTLSFKIIADGKAEIPVISGDVCGTGAPEVSCKGSFWKFWKSSPEGRIETKNSGYYLYCPEAGEYEVKMTFAAKIVKDGVSRTCSFYLLPAVTRNIRLTLSGQNTDAKVTDAPGFPSEVKTENGITIYNGILQPAGSCTVNWKKIISGTEVLSAGVEANIVGAVQTGAVKFNSRFEYKVFQGRLSSLQLFVPKDVNVLEITGQDIREWRTEPAKDGSIVKVELLKEQEKTYTLLVQAEKILTGFPCQFNFQPIVPKNVMRFGGMMRLGAGRGVKLIVQNTPGLVQVDSATIMPQLPAYAFLLNNPYTYTFSTPDLSLTALADNITPYYTGEVNCSTVCGDRTVSVRLDCVIDVRDAPVKDIRMEYLPEYTFSKVSGDNIRPQDYDLISDGARRIVKIPFMSEMTGRVSFSVFFEKELKDEKNFSLPAFKIEGIKSVRGYLALAAERGLKLTPEQLNKLTPVYAGSVPVRVAGMQYAYLFRDQDWSGKVLIEQLKGNIAAESFHLISVGDGTAYGSTVLSLNITGSPVDKLVFKADDALNNLDFKGHGIISRRKLGPAAQKGFSLWEVRLQKKILGSFTLLASYEISLKGGETIRLGGLSCDDADSSGSFIALTGGKTFRIHNGTAAPGVQEIEQAELPEEYLNMITNPVLKVFRGSAREQWQEVKIERYDKCGTPQLIVERAELNTRIDSNGGCVTEAEYRIKNSAEQFFALRLPPGSALWSVSVEGKRKRLSDEKGELLIPLPRHQNINTPVAVSITYATKQEPVRSFAQMAFAAPETTAKMLHSRWSFSLPENCSVVSSTPDQIGRKDFARPGIAGVTERALAYLKAWLENGIIIAWLVFTLAGLLVLWSRTGERKLIITPLLGLIFMLGSGLYMLARLCQAGFNFNRSFIVNQMEFTKVMNLTATPFTVDLGILNMESFSPWALLVTAAAVVFITILVYAGIKINRKFTSGLLFGAALALLMLAASQWMKVNIVAGFALAALVPLLLTCGLWTVAWRNLCALLLIAFVCCGFSAQADNIVIDSFACRTKIGDKAAISSATFKITAVNPGEIEILRSPAAATAFDISSSDCKIVRDGNRYLLKVSGSGSYAFSVDFLSVIKRDERQITFQIPVPQCLSNTITVQALAGSEIKSANAVFFRQDKNGAAAGFVPGDDAVFEVARTQAENVAEPAKFFAGITTHIAVGRGSVEIKDVIELNIPQGSISSLTITVPKEYRVTNVDAAGLESWQFQRDTGIMKVLFNRPLSGDAAITMVSQLTDGKLPRDCALGVIKVENASRQYGTTGIFVDPGVKIEISGIKDFAAINNSYFKIATLGEYELKNAYRYAGTDATMSVKVSEVKPELRVEEESRVNFDDERITLSSKLDLDVVKGGIFAASLELPAGYEIMKITGGDVQHWDEMKAGAINTAVINFNKRISGKTALFVELARMSGYENKKIEIPSVKIAGAGKLTGALTVALEKGASLNVIQRDGVIADNEGFTGTPGNSSRFKILRPAWTLIVGLEQTPTWIQLKTLEVVRVKDAAAECDFTLLYAIENAGVKSFLVQLPDNSESPEFTGRFIASAGKVKDNLWKVELNRKVEHSYRLNVKCRLIQADPAKLQILPLKSPDSGIQTGYVAVFAEDSLQLRPGTAAGDASVFNPRSIPPEFGVSGLSGAALCFRSVGKDCNMNVEISRHKTAEVLKAAVESVSIKSLLSPAGQMICEVSAVINNDSRTFLPVKLPETGVLWAAFVDSAPVDAVAGKDSIMIPLRQGNSGASRQTVNFIYSCVPGKKWSQDLQSYAGPQFDIPLRNVTWDLFLPENSSYSRFGGTLAWKDEFISSFNPESLQKYDAESNQRIKSEKGRAQELLSLGSQYYNSGNKDKAIQAFQSAIDISGDKALRSDIQGQLMQNTRGENVKNISRRRDAVAQNRYAAEPQAKSSSENGEPAGDELKSLQDISDRIFLQQQAAAALPQVIRADIPWQGKKVTFERALEIQNNAPLEVNFNAEEKLKASSFAGYFGFILMLVAFSTIFMLLIPARR